MRLAAAAVATLVVAGCATHCPPDPAPDSRAEYRVTCGAVETRGCTAALLAFPVNVVPNIVIDTLVPLLDPIVSPLVGAHPGNLWPIATLVAPAGGPITGFTDALRGRPFWDTWGVRGYCEKLAFHAEAEMSTPGE